MIQGHCYYESGGLFLHWGFEEPDDEGETDTFLEILWSAKRIGKKHFQRNKQKDSFQKRQNSVIILRTGSYC